MAATISRPAFGYRSYESFEPQFQWVREESNQTLLIDLPGFKKEHLKVQLDSYGNLKVSGERPLSGNRWSQFRKDFRVPENSSTDEIRAKFEDGLLYVIIPKVITSTNMLPGPESPVRQPEAPRKQKPGAARPTKPSPKEGDKAKISHAAPSAVGKPAAHAKPPTESLDDRKDGGPKLQDKEEQSHGLKGTTEKVTPRKENMRRDERDTPTRSGTSHAVKEFPKRFKDGSQDLGLRMGTRRQLVVNVVVAMLVLVVLGMYVTQRFRKSHEPFEGHMGI